MSTMVEKLGTLWPEIILGLGACACLATGLARTASKRRLPVWVAGTSLLVAGVVVVCGPRGVEAGALPPLMGSYLKLIVVGVGFLLLLVAAHLPAHAQAGPDRAFDPADSMRGEFFAFFLFSLMGVMLCAGADDLVWLFLALELTSLPTYVMVATSQDRAGAQEAGVKYFFLGAMAAALFLYGFTLMYGATGFTQFSAIRDSVAASGDMSPLFLCGLILAIVGVSFKIAAVPMHFYAADVYQGAATPVTAFLAFVPKTAGFIAILLLLGTVPGWATREPLLWLLWGMAALTMTVGNVLGLLQGSVKRVLAYSSIAHSGYMLVGLLAGPGRGETLGNGVAAVLFYLLVYGLGTLGAFAVLGCLESGGREADGFEDLSGLNRRSPLLAAILGVSVLSLMGLPPVAGFVGKLYLFGSAMTRAAEHPAFVWLVVIGVLNSAVAAVYYLRIIGACYFGAPNEHVRERNVPARRIAALVSVLGVLVLGVRGGRLVDAVREVSQRARQTNVVARPVPGQTRGEASRPTNDAAAEIDMSRDRPKNDTVRF